MLQWYFCEIFYRGGSCSTCFYTNEDEIEDDIKKYVRRIIGHESYSYSYKLQDPSLEFLNTQLKSILETLETLNKQITFYQEEIIRIKGKK